MELFLLYVWMKLDLVPWVLIPVIVTCCVIWVVLLMRSDSTSIHWREQYNQLSYKKREELSFDQFIKDEKEKINYKKSYRKLLVVGGVASVLLVLIPTQTQTAVLVAGHYALRLADSPEANKVMQLLRRKANEYLDQELKGK